MNSAQELSGHLDSAPTEVKAMYDQLFRLEQAIDDLKHAFRMEGHSMSQKEVEDMSNKLLLMEECLKEAKLDAAAVDKLDQEMRSGPGPR